MHPVLLMRPRGDARPWRLVLDAVGGAFLLLLAIQLLVRPGETQRDIDAYLSAGYYVLRGQNPNAVYDGPYGPFVYPFPPGLGWLFVPLTLLGETAAKFVWLALKIVAVLLTVRLWRPVVGARPATRIPPAFFLAFACASTLPFDVLAGNVSVFEQLLLGLGLVALIHGRTWRFAIMVALAAQAKLMLVLFLGLLLVIDVRPRWAQFVGGCALFLGLLTASFHGSARSVRAFIETSGQLADQRGVLNPSILALWKSVLAVLEGRTGLRLPALTGWLLYAAVTGPILFVSMRWWVRRRSLDPNGRATLALFAMVLYALVAPRMMLYSFAVLLPPAWHIVQRAPADTPTIPLVAIPILVPLMWSELLRVPYLQVVYDYWPLAVAIALWLAYLRLPIGGAALDARPVVPATPVGMDAG